MANDSVDPFNELVTTWNPDWLQGTSEAIRQCWVEVKEQFPGDELRHLATEFHKRSVEHAGTSAPTFIELVCKCLAGPLCLIGEKQCSERIRRETLAELMKVDAGFLSAEIGRELSWLVLNRGEGTFTRSHDSDRRLVGVFGLVSIIGETTDWIRSMVKVDQTGSPSPVAPMTTAIEPGATGNEGELDWLETSHGDAPPKDKKPSKRRAPVQNKKPELLVRVKTLVTTLKLKGKQRRVVELLIEGEGEFPINDLASDDAIGWKAPYKNTADSMKRVLSGKFGQHGILVEQFANSLRLKPMAKQLQKQK